MKALFVNLLWVALVGAGCYEPNVAHHLPDYDAKHEPLQRAFGSINKALAKALADPIFAATSFSVEVTSSKESLWSRHHTARERNTSRPDIPEVNGDALYRIASITKSFTVLGILYQHNAGNLSLDDSIEKYIPELQGEQEGSLLWKSITLRSLASQLSGIPRDFAQSDLVNDISWLPWKAADMGLPPVSRKGLIQCDEYGDNYEPPCERGDLLTAVKSMAPVFAPNQKSTYSNVAFELLGLVLENVTNQSYDSYIDEAIFKPLGMKKSSLSQPPDSAGVIPRNPHYWDVDEGIQAPTGGIYSSTIDLSKYLRYILAHYNGITDALNWAHPTSPADGLHSFYGTPWEIFRTDRILRNSTRTVRFITKAGGLPGYTSIIMTVPEYDLGITILLAGNARLFSQIQEIVTVEIVRAAEEIAINQLQERYAGSYVSTNPDLNSSLTLVADRRGLVVERFISNSTDVLASPFPIFGGAPIDRAWYAQLVPTLLYRNESKQEGERWRMMVSQERADDERRVWDDFCSTNVDGASYADAAINEVVFWMGKDKTFDSIDLTGFRVKLSRQHEDHRLWLDGQDQELLEL